MVFGDATTSQAGEAQPHDLMVDRCYIHGDPVRGQKRGIALNSGSTTVVYSYISDIKSAAQDAQAIAGWSGTGPFLVENNYLEARARTSCSAARCRRCNGLVPSDVVFRRNHLSRPVAWRSQNWVIKNLFELKNARRVLVEGNLFENHWVDDQPGYAIVLTPRGERGAAPWATVEDLTFRYNIIRNVAAAFNLLARDDNGPSGTMRRVRIADNLVIHVDRNVWGGNGTFMQIGEGPPEIVVEHNTIIQTANLLTAYGGSSGSPSAAERFVFRNNIALHNANGVIGQGLGIGTDTLNGYFPGGAFLRNVLAGGPRLALSRRQPLSRHGAVRAAVRELRERRLQAQAGQRIPPGGVRRRGSRRQLHRARPRHRRPRPGVARNQVRSGDASRRCPRRCGIRQVRSRFDTNATVFT